MDDLDGVTVAPDNHKVLFENDAVRVLETTIVDTRADPDFVLPKVLYAQSTPKHTIENTGTDDLVVIGVELKAARRLSRPSRRGGMGRPLRSRRASTERPRLAGQLPGARYMTVVPAARSTSSGVRSTIVRLLTAPEVPTAMPPAAAASLPGRSAMMT